MANAYEAQLRRRERCRDTVTCTTCGAPPGFLCVQAPNLGMGTMRLPSWFMEVRSTQNMPKDYERTRKLWDLMNGARFMGGLHKARWAAQPDSAVDALAEIVVNA